MVKNVIFQIIFWIGSLQRNQIDYEKFKIYEQIKWPKAGPVPRRRITTTHGISSLAARGIRNYL